MLLIIQYAHCLTFPQLGSPVGFLASYWQLKEVCHSKISGRPLHAPGAANGTEKWMSLGRTHTTCSRAAHKDMQHSAPKRGQLLSLGCWSHTDRQQNHIYHKGKRPQPVGYSATPVCVAGAHGFAEGQHHWLGSRAEVLRRWGWGQMWTFRKCISAWSLTKRTTGKGCQTLRQVHASFLWHLRVSPRTFYLLLLPAPSAGQIRNCTIVDAVPLPITSLWAAFQTVFHPSTQRCCSLSERENFPLLIFNETLIDLLHWTRAYPGEGRTRTNVRAQNKCPITNSPKRPAVLSCQPEMWHRARSSGGQLLRGFQKVGLLQVSQVGQAVSRVTAEM